MEFFDIKFDESFIGPNGGKGGNGGNGGNDNNGGPVQKRPDNAELKGVTQQGDSIFVVPMPKM